MHVNTPQRDSYAYRVLRTVQRFGDAGCTIAQFSAAFYTSRTLRHNSMGSQALTSVSNRGLVMTLDPDAPARHRIFVLSAAGREFIDAQLRAAAARARELAEAHSGAPLASGEASPNDVGAWDR